MNIMDLIGTFFGWLVKECYLFTNNFGWAIWLFTFLTKIILLPVSVMVQLNSIKMVKMYPEMNRYKAKYYGDKAMISEAQYNLYKREKYHPMLDLIPVIIQLILLMGVVEGIYRLIDEGHEMTWLGLNLADIPIKTGGAVLIIPALAALSALLMCVTQNLSNVLQSEQSMANKGVTLGISVGLSLYLGLFVPAGIGLYWIAGNLLSIVLMYVLNFCINPKKHIDYEELEASKAELKKLSDAQNAAKKSRSKEEIAKEKADYRRFIKYGSKQIVFYAERNGFYKYFKDVIEYIQRKTDIEIHYVSGDINDEALGLASDSFHTYYIGENKLIVLMMKMDADIVVMTTPDLQTYHIKRSLIRDDIEYVYMDHGISSINLLLRKHALDHFDTVFVANDSVKSEILAQEQAYNLPHKNIVECGYGLLDNMIASFGEGVKKNDVPTILIAPSWQEDNLVDLCIDEILNNLLGREYRVILRPHPQYVRHCESKLMMISEKYKDREDFDLQMDFSSNSTVYEADILMTDWSGIVYEYSFTTLRPTLFIDTPMKVMNPDYKEIDVVPMDIEIRNKIGLSVSVDELNRLPEVVDTLLKDHSFSRESLKQMRSKYLYNIGHSAEVGGKYLVNRIVEKSRK